MAFLKIDWIVFQVNLLYLVFWKKDKIKRILANGDAGPLSVLYGGPHQSQPAFGKVRAGVRVYPFTVMDGVLYLIARMTISEMVDADDFLANTLRIANPEYMWDTYWSKHKNEVTHQIPTTCADDAALGSDGTSLHLREIPAEIAAQIRLDPKPGQGVPLKTKDGKIATTGLIGYYRRLSAASAALLDEFFLEDHLEV